MKMKPINSLQKNSISSGAPECFFAPILWAVFASSTVTGPLRTSTGAVLNACWADTSDE